MAIAFDNTAVNLVTTSTTNSLSLTNAGNFLVANIFNTSGDTLSTITATKGGAQVAMTLIKKRVGLTGEEMYSYGILTPDIGTVTVTATFSSGNVSRLHVSTYTLASTSMVLGSLVVTEGTGTSTSATGTLTTPSDNDWTFLFVRANDNITAGTGSTIRGASNTSAIFDSNAAVHPAASHSMSFNVASSQQYAYIMYAFAPAVGTAYTSTLTETVTTTASLLKVPTRILSETITNTATLIKTATRTLAETITNTATFLDQIVHAKTLSDTITNSDTFARVLTAVRTVTETISNTDTLLKTSGRALTETITSTASLIKTAGKVLLETVTNTDLFTEGIITTVGPRSPGTVINDTSYGSGAWINPGNAAASDDTYADEQSATTQSNYLKATNFGFSIPAGVTILGIKVEIEKKSSGTAYP